MAYIRSRVVKGTTYYQLVEGYREPHTGRVRHRTVGLGTKATLPEAIAEAEREYRRVRALLKEAAPLAGSSRPHARRVAQLESWLRWIARKLATMRAASVDTTAKA